MPPIIAIIGRSGSGKTTLIEKLIGYFGSRGLRIAIIKHMRHDFDIDHPGKDTHRYRDAGARASAIMNDREFAMTMSIDGPLSPSEAAERFFPGLDLVIVEGFKEGAIPKIEVIGDGGEAPLLDSGIDDIIAVVTDRDVRIGAPLFRRDDVEGVAALIEKRFMKV